MAWREFSPESNQRSKCEIYFAEIPPGGVDDQKLRRSYPKLFQGITVEVGEGKVTVIFPRAMMGDAINERLKKLIDMFRAENYITAPVTDHMFHLDR